MSLTLIGLLIYLVFLVGFAIFSSFGIYHLLAFGFVGDLSKPVVISYILVSLAIISLTLIFVLANIIGS